MRSFIGLQGARVLIIEDDYLQAKEITGILLDAGALIVGPYPSVARAQGNLRGPLPHAALLDLNVLHGTTFDFARQLLARGMPLMFVTSGGCHALPAEFSASPCLDKPLDRTTLVRVMADVLRDVATYE